MQRDRDLLLYSATDLIQYNQSEFASWSDRLELEQPSAISVPAKEDELLEALCQLGSEYETKFIRSLAESGANIYKIEQRGTYNLTIDAMTAGYDYIYQAALKDDGFIGYADLMVRVDVPSNLGNWSYIPLECKLALTPRPDFVLQACTYCDLLASVQGIRPAEFQLLLGSGEIQTHPTEQYFYYYQRVRQSFLEFMSAFDADAMPMPTPGDDRHGRWQDYANTILLDRDHLSQVANITRSQIRKLETAGITTFKQLASIDPALKIPHLNPVVLSRLVAQARLQQATISTGIVNYETIAPPAPDLRQGLAILPPSSPLDVYFDMEGYPLVHGGLEYLFGAIIEDAAAEKGLTFYDWWAHNETQEQQAFEQFIDWVYDRWQQDPKMHIYHYAPYETTAVKRLMGKYATRESQVDDLLRSGVFIDLYQIVRQGVRVGQPSYSIKKLEPLYDCNRVGEVQNAADSVLQYFRWTRGQEGETPDRSQILADIRDYNRIDCESTKYLVDWLRSLQREHQISYIDRHQSIEPEPDSEPKQNQAAELAAKILASVAEQSPSEQARIQTLLAHLLQFHQREAKPFWWQRFSWLEADEADLGDELDCLAGIERTNLPPFKPSPKSRSLAYEYRFDPSQETRLEAKTSCWFAPAQLGQGCSLDTIDRATGLLTITITEKRLQEIRQQYSDWEPPHRTSLIDVSSISTKSISQAVLQTVQQWYESKLLQPALQNFLDRQPPRIDGHPVGEPIVSSGEDLVEGTIRAVSNLDRSTLCIQGPPGSGKTYTAAKVILHLLKAGKSIAICANSHKVITNLMARIAKLAKAEGFDFKGAKIGGDSEDEIFQYQSIHFKQSVDLALPPDTRLVGATAFQLSRESAIGKFDYLFIDEAGQMSLANLIAIARCTDNLVLVGDPMQLEQPMQGSHPGESGCSALNYFLNGQATVPPEMGIFLDTSYRMHPSICRFISDAIYEGRLQSAEQTDRHQVKSLTTGENWHRESGILFIPVEHEDNSQSSEEEINIVEKVVAQMLGRAYVSDRGGRIDRIQFKDILIVAPYNLQVRKLKERLDDRARIGTVDKFQGQEAPILIASMCSSNADTIPRGLEFLLDRHRINVAISRAQCLSLVIASPTLARAACSTLEQVKLVNLFCKLVA